MVLPPPLAHDAPRADSPGWLRRLKVSLGLSRAGVLLLVDYARPERLGELVRALLPVAPELEVYTEAPRMAEVAPGSTVVLIPREEDTDWLNLNRPLFSSRQLRVVVFCTREVSVALARGAVDFVDWMSLRVDCPPGPAPFAVAGLRAALASRAPGVVWTGGDLEASFAAARPRRKLREVSAARPYAELVAEAKANRGEWLAWTDIDGEFRLRRVRWALAEARRRTPSVLVEPSVTSPGWKPVHGRVMPPGEARVCLESAGARNPGRLAALANLKPESIQLLRRFLEQGAPEATLEEELRQGKEPDAESTAREPAPPSWNLDVRLKHEPRTGQFWDELANLAVDMGDVEAAHEWAEFARKTEPKAWKLPVRVLRGQGQYTEAEALLRRHLAEDSRMTRADRDWTYGMLSQMLHDQGRNTEAEALLRQPGLLGDKTTEPWQDGSTDHVRLLAQVLLGQNKYAEAEKLLSRFLAARWSAGAERSFETIELLQDLASLLDTRGRYQDAEKLIRACMEILARAGASSSPAYADSLHALSSALDHQERYDEAVEVLLQALSLKERLWGRHHPTHAASLQNLASLRIGQNRLTEAEELLDKASSIIQQAHGVHSKQYLSSVHNLAIVRERQGQYAGAEKLMRQAVVLSSEVFGHQSLEYAHSLHQLALILERQGRYTESEAPLREAIGLIESSLGPDNPRLVAPLQILGASLAKQDKVLEAESLLLRALSLGRKHLGRAHPKMAYTLYAISVLEHSLNRKGAAKRARQAMEALQAAYGPEHPLTQEATPVLRRIVAARATQ